MFTIYLLIVAIVIAMSLLYFSCIEILAKKVLEMANITIQTWTVAVSSCSLLLLGMILLNALPFSEHMMIASAAGIIASAWVKQKYSYSVAFWTVIVLNVILGGAL